MRRLKAAVAGAGLMGSWHAYYARRCGADVVAVCDPDQSAVDSFKQRRPRVASFITLEDCLREQLVDVVHVCTPPESHVPLIETALARGRHVLCEKPLCRTANEADKLSQMARDHNLTLRVVHQAPLQRGVRNLLRRRDRLGRPVRVAVTIYSAGGAGLSASERNRLLLEILAHPFSLIQTFFGSLPDLSAWRLERYSDDALDLAAEFRDCRVAVSIDLRARPTRHEFEVVGTDGTAVADLFHGFSTFTPGTASRSAKVLRPFRVHGTSLVAASFNMTRRLLCRQPAYSGLCEVIGDFYASVSNAASQRFDSEEMIDVVRHCEAVERIARQAEFAKIEVKRTCRSSRQ